ncbi:MAG: sulfite exporter TauE/SafE family protein [Rubripirellula sp.]
MDVEFTLSLIPFALILCAGIFVQAAAGFAAGLMIVPALLWFGYTIPAAQCSLLVATIPQNSWGVWSLRESIRWKDVAWPGFGRIAFLPVGVWGLQMLESLNVDTVRQIVGAVVLCVTIAIMIFRPKPQERLNPAWAFLAFPMSGFLQGLVGMGGPAMVFWVQAHDWGTKKTRAFLFAMYLVSIVPALGFLYAGFGNRILSAGLIAAAMIPLLLVVTFFGLKFGTKLGRERLRRVTLALLLIMGLAGVIAPMLN